VVREVRHPWALSLTNFKNSSGLLRTRVESSKVQNRAFCLIDLQPLSSRRFRRPKFTDCNKRTKGRLRRVGPQSYASNLLPCQFLGIDTVPDGRLLTFLRSTNQRAALLRWKTRLQKHHLHGLRIQPGRQPSAEIPLPFLCDIRVFTHWALVRPVLFAWSTTAELVWVHPERVRSGRKKNPWGPLSAAERDILTALATRGWRHNSRIRDRPVLTQHAEAVVTAARLWLIKVAGAAHHQLTLRWHRPTEHVTVLGRTTCSRFRGGQYPPGSQRKLSVNVSGTTTTTLHPFSKPLFSSLCKSQLPRLDSILYSIG